MMVFRAFVLLALVNAVRCKSIQITIPDGRLRGSVLRDYDRWNFYSFTKVPFAKPPLGKYRFNRAEPNEPWKGVLDATKPAPLCSQANPTKTALIGQEDCLYLNVYTKSTKKYFLKPVMVFVHGGSLIEGGTAEYGPEFLMTADIVLVTISYRLGVYGFINTLISAPQANAEPLANTGFKDQILALKWVQKNIRYFGGNPNKVTFVGHSAGGTAVHANMLSPLSHGLYHQAAFMSASALTVALQSFEETATPLAKKLEINTTNYETMMADLRNTSNDDLFQATKALNWYGTPLNEPVLAGLVIEKPGLHSFLAETPMKIIQSGNYKKIPFMAGSTNREGLLPYSMFGPTNGNLSMHVPFFLANKDEVEKKIKEYYNLASGKNTAGYINFLSDIWFTYSVFRAVREHVQISNHQKVYFYQFTGEAKLNYLKAKQPDLREFPGASHADDLGYLFQTVGVPTHRSMEEKMMRNMVKLWSNFVKYGKPNWKLKTFKKNSYNYINIDNSGLSYSVRHHKAFGFWDEIYKNYSNIQGYLKLVTIPSKGCRRGHYISLYISFCIFLQHIR